jgi:pilus assembly protein CpaB
MLAVSAFLIITALAVGFLFKRLFAAEPLPEIVDTTEQVPMAVANISSGTMVQRAHLGRGPWEKAKLSEYPDTILSTDALVGRIAKEDIPAATPLRASMFYAAGEGPDLTVSAPGMRAVAVNVGDTTEMVNGLIKPGEYVDVFMTVDRGPVVNDVDQRDSNAMTLKLFDGVKVLAINGSYTQSTSAQGNVVVLEMNQTQQEIMVLAKNKGSISLTFNPEGPGTGGLSVQTSKEDRVTLHELLGLEDPEKEPEPFVTEQYRNGGRSEAFYDEDGRVYRGDRYGNGSNFGGGAGAGGTPLQGTSSGSWFGASLTPQTSQSGASGRQATSANSSKL